MTDNRASLSDPGGARRAQDSLAGRAGSASSAAPAALVAPTALRAVACVTLATVLIPVAEGKATRYDPGVMDKVVANRVRWRQLDLSQPHAGYIALADKQYIGKLAWIQWPATPALRAGASVELAPDGPRRPRLITGPYLVADCGKEKDQQYLREIGFAVDLSWELAEQLGVIDRPLQGVTVYIQEEKRP